MLNHKKNDLRVIKTYKVITGALFKLMENNNFRRVTVNELCKEAQISRATFYAHFEDKYDLLNYIIGGIIEKFDFEDSAYDDLAGLADRLVQQNKSVIKNLFKDADDDTLKILYSFILSAVNIYEGEVNDVKYVVLSNMVAGGIRNYLYWHISNNFPSRISVMNVHLYEILQMLTKWYAESR